MNGDHVQLSQRDAVLMRALIHVVQYEQNPLDVVTHVLATVIHSGTLASLEEYREALDAALASDVELTKLAPEYHPEVIVRRYLAEVRRRLTTPMN